MKKLLPRRLRSFRHVLVASFTVGTGTLACSGAPTADAPTVNESTGTTEAPLLSNVTTMPGTASGGVGVASWAPGRLDAFFVTTRRTLGHVWSGDSGTSWAGVEDLGGSLAVGSTPAAVSWGYGRIDVFVTNASNVIDHVWYDMTIPGGFRWDAVSTYMAGWHTNPDAHVGSPAVASWGPNRLDIFYVAADKTVRHKWHGETGWGYGEESLGGIAESAPSATSWGANRIDVAVIGSGTYGISHKAYFLDDGVGWHEWDGARDGYYGIVDPSSPVKRGLQPAITSTGADMLDLFFITGGIVAREHWHWSWSDAEGEGGFGASIAAVATRGSPQVHVIGTSATGVMQHALYAPTPPPPPPFCGDRVCNGGETPYTCSRDCGSPPPPCTTHTWQFCDFAGYTVSGSGCTMNDASADAYTRAHGGGIAHVGACAVVCGGGTWAADFQCCASSPYRQSYLGYGCSDADAKSNARLNDTSCTSWVDGQTC